MNHDDQMKAALLGFLALAVLTAVAVMEWRADKREQEMDEKILEPLRRNSLAQFPRKVRPTVLEKLQQIANRVHRRG